MAAEPCKTWVLCESEEEDRKFKKKKNWIAGEGTNKSVRIRIENRDHTFTVRLNGLCLLSCLLGGLTVLV